MKFALIQRMALIAVAGAIGTVARYVLQAAVQRASGVSFPWGTLAVNVLGSFLFGVVLSLAEERLVISSEARALLLVGFMGAFTTFSTYAFETLVLLRNSEYLLAGGYVLLQTVLGVGAVMLGIAAVRLL